MQDSERPPHPAAPAPARAPLPGARSVVPQGGSRQLLAWLLVGQALLLAWASLRNLDTFNDDAVAYLMIARHYADLRFGLAVNGYWGPLSSWFLLPFLGLPRHGLIAVRIVSDLAALLYAAAAARFLRRCDLPPRAVPLGTVLAALFAVSAGSGGYDAPDLLVAALLLLGASCELGGLARPDTRTALKAGLCYGFAYLAKPVGLPTGALLLGLFFLARVSIDRATLGTALRLALVSAGGILLLAAPWIAIVSLHYGAFTVATSGALNHALVAPGYPPLAQPTFTGLHVPQAGRITTWEDPTGLPYPQWSVFGSRANVIHQLRLIVANLGWARRWIMASDALGAGLVASLAGLVFASRRLASERWRLSLPILAVLVGVYLPFFIEDRYLDACYVVLLAAAFGFYPRLDLRASEGLRLAFVFVLLGIGVVPTLERPLFGSRTIEFVRAEQLQPLLRLPGGIAEAGEVDDTAFYTAYLAGAPFVGGLPENGTIADLRAVHARYLFAESGSAIDLALKADQAGSRVRLVATGLAAGSFRENLYEIE